MSMEDSRQLLDRRGLSEASGKRQHDGRTRVPERKAPPPLFRERRKLRQFADVARIVLDDECRLQVRYDLLHALDRGNRLGSIVVEYWHTIRIVILAKVDGIATENDGTHLRQLDQQAGMARSVPRRAQHD